MSMQLAVPDCMWSLTGGEGPKLSVLQDMVARHQLQERVQLLGAVAHRWAPLVCILPLQPRAAQDTQSADMPGFMCSADKLK